MNEEVVIDVKNLGHYFGDIKAVDDISFQVKKGEVLGFLGPNGAGKSTTMRMLAGFISPSFGKATIKGFDVNIYPDEVKQNIGYLPENAPAYEDMTVFDFLDFIASVRGLEGTDKKGKINSVISLISLETVRNRRIEMLSKGFKRRVCLAQAIIHEPDILILDEPTDGLDPNQKHEIRELIRKMSVEKVIILSTHILEEVEEVCSRVIIIANGQIKKDGTPEELLASSETAGAVTITLNSDIIKDASEFFKNKSSVKKVELLENTKLSVFPEKRENFTKNIIEECNQHSWEILDIFVDKGNLAKVFRKITTRGV